MWPLRPRAFPTSTLAAEHYPPKLKVEAVQRDQCRTKLSMTPKIKPISFSRSSYIVGTTFLHVSLVGFSAQHSDIGHVDFIADTNRRRNCVVARNSEIITCILKYSCGGRHPNLYPSRLLH